MQFPGRDVLQLVSDVSPHGSPMCQEHIQGKHLPALKWAHHSSRYNVKYFLIAVTIFNVVCTPVRAASLHTVFTTECTPYFTWQSIGEQLQV